MLRLLARGAGDGRPPTPVTINQLTHPSLEPTSPPFLQAYNATVESYPQLVWLIMVGYLVLAQGALYWAWLLAREERGKVGDGESEGGLRRLLLGKAPEGKQQEAGDEECGTCVWWW